MPAGSIANATRNRGWSASGGTMGFCCTIAANSSAPFTTTGVVTWKRVCTAAAIAAASDVALRRLESKTALPLLRGVALADVHATEEDDEAGHRSTS